MLSLHQLPTRDECRPLLAEPHHAFASHLSDSPRPPSGARAHVSSPRVCVELHAIGGFHAIAREPQPPPEAQGVTRLVTAVAEGNGLNPTFDETFHCLAAEPHQTILRVVVEDEGRLVAYETAMLGSLRCGYRCLHLRSPSGTQIDSCCLLLHISVSTEPNTYGTVDELRVMMQSQRSLISQQGRDIHQLSAELSWLGSQPSTPIASAPAAGPRAARWPLELALDAGVNGARAGRPSPIALPPGAALTVGRDASNGVALFPLTQRHISRQHAVLHVAADGRSVRLEDVSRKNGCRVQQGAGGESVLLQSTAEEVATAQVREGSVLTFGQPGDADEFRYVIRAAGTEDSPAWRSERETRRATELSPVKTRPFARSTSSSWHRGPQLPSSSGDVSSGDVVSSGDLSRSRLARRKLDVRHDGREDAAVSRWLSPPHSRPSPYARSSSNWESPLSSASRTPHLSKKGQEQLVELALWHGAEVNQRGGRERGCMGMKPALGWTERLPAPSMDSDDSSCDSENDEKPVHRSLGRLVPQQNEGDAGSDPEPASPAPSLPPPSLPGSSPSPSSVPPELRDGLSPARSLAFFAGAGISSASAPQKRRYVHAPTKA